ncbi:MAG: hypothetical protein IKT42_03115 [Clostridia bacterium]|nr:hypothetical protein [Clostridia bacterium]
MLTDDLDVKIAGDKPSEDVRRNKNNPVQNSSVSSEQIKAAKAIGKAVANSFIRDAETEVDEEFRDFDMIVQRRLLLSFTATAGFEKYIGNDTLDGIAQKSFLDTINKHSTELYKTSSDTGAFSFYYLAFRRGSEVERRIGQTFAMLCSHDGDPIFQELGEALYCWFLSVVRKAVAEYLNA